MGAGQRIINGFQHLDDAIGRAASETADTGDDGTDVGNMEAIDVFIRTDCLNDFLLVDVTWQRKLYQNSVYRIIFIELFQKR